MVYVLYLTAISTGLRAGELAGLQWADVDFGTRLITVQRSFEQPTKSDDVRYVPILDSLLPELRRWRLEQPGRLVFTNQNGTMLGKCARAYQEVLRRVLDRANFPRIQRGGKERRYIHFHDLRHTFASRWVMKGGDLFKLQKILGHKSMAMTLRYAHLQPSAFAEDYGRFGVGEPAQNGLVVELPVARRARNQP
jgi:integrase